MRNFMGAIRGVDVLNFDAEQPYFYAAGAYFYAEQPYFYAAGAYFYANQPYFYAAGACFYAEQPYFYGTCASLHGKVSHFYAEVQFLRRTCVFLRRRGGPYGPPYFLYKYLSSLVLSSCFRKIASQMALILPLV